MCFQVENVVVRDGKTAGDVADEMTLIVVHHQ